MKTISLTKGMDAIVDDVDYMELSKYKWHARKTPGGYYACRNARRVNGKQVPIMMHSLLCPVPTGMEVDHVDGDPLNNTRNNLRACTRSQNQFNKGKYKNNTSGYKGVGYIQRTGRWRVRINVNRETIYLGNYETKEFAASVYNEACLRYHLKFAKPNII